MNTEHGKKVKVLSCFHARNWVDNGYPWLMEKVSLEVYELVMFNYGLMFGSLWSGEYFSKWKSHLMA